MSECDHCGQNRYTADNPFVEHRQRRPSASWEMTCTLAGHKNCLAKSTELPSIGEEGGVATHEQWEEWLKSPDADKHGYVLLS